MGPVTEAMLASLFMVKPSGWRLPKRYSRACAAGPPFAAIFSASAQQTGDKVRLHIPYLSTHLNNCSHRLDNQTCVPMALTMGRPEITSVLLKKAVVGSSVHLGSAALRGRSHDGIAGTWQAHVLDSRFRVMQCS